MQAILSFLSEIFSQPAFLMGIIAFVGLVALRSPGNKLLTGTLKPILGYLMLSAGAGVIVANLNPLGGIIEAGFNIRGVIPNNEAIVSVAQKVLGVETMSILLLGFIFNLLIARCTKEGANKQVISSQADSLIKISRIWADFFPANTSN